MQLDIARKQTVYLIIDLFVHRDFVFIVYMLYHFFMCFITSQNIIKNINNSKIIKKVGKNIMTIVNSSKTANEIIKAMKTKIENYVESIPEREINKGEYVSIIGHKYVHTVDTHYYTTTHKYSIFDFYNKYKHRF